MKPLRFFLAPLLLIALITTSLYVGLARPGAGKTFAKEVVTSQEVRKDIAEALIDQFTNSDDVLLTALLTTNRAKAEDAIAKSLSEPVEQEQIGDAVESLLSAMFTGKPTVEIASEPIYRPIYQGLDAVFPALNLTQDLSNLEPIVVGKDSALPNLKIVRTLLTGALLLWPIWFLLVFLYVRRNKRDGWRLVAIHSLVIAGISTLITFGAPMLLQGLVTDPLQKVLVASLVSQLTFAALWISLALVIASTVVLLLTRERVLPSQSPTQSE